MPNPLNNNKNYNNNNKFVKFWGDTWEKDDRTPEVPWMKSVSKR